MSSTSADVRTCDESVADVSTLRFALNANDERVHDTCIVGIILEPLVQVIYTRQ